ncbi:MAG: Ig-like domain-containing protein [Chloroflexota bacterium]
MKCDRALLSAYIDHELNAAERLQIEAHVIDCPECAQQLERYRGVRFQLRNEAPRRAPSELRARVESQMRARRRKENLRWLPLAVGAPLSVIGIVAGAALLGSRGEPSAPLAVTATSPMSGAQRVAPGGAVELWFDRELMPGTGGVTVTVDPPVPVRIIVDGNALRIEPDTAFESGQNYTVAVESALDVDGRRLKQPALVSFVTAPPVVAEVRPELGSPRGVPGVSANGAAASDPASIGGKSAAPISPLAGVPSTIAGPSVDTVSLTAQTQKWPGSRAIASVPAADPPTASYAVGDTLGALVAPYQTVRVLEQAFQGGVMLKIGDSAQTLVLQRGRGTWDSHLAVYGQSSEVLPDASLPPPPGALAPSGAFGALWERSPSVRSALGWAVYEPRVTSALVQQREQGRAITLGRMAYLLRSNGSWIVVPLSKAPAPSN